MPLFFLLRALFSLLSLIVLGVAVYFLWTWYQGKDLIDTAGVAHHIREDWRLWWGLGLLAFSFLGKFVLKPLLARRDTEKLNPSRGAGQPLPGADGAQLHVEVAGKPDAPVIVFTHGWAMDSTIWAYTKRHFEKQYRLIFWDLPGLGLSTAGSSNSISLSAFAQDLKTVITLAGSSKVLLVGHSIGGMTIQTLARDNPDLFSQRVAGVVLVNTTYTNPLKTMILPRLMQALQKPLIEPLMHLTRWLEPLAWLSAWQSYLNGTAHLTNRFGFGRYVTHSQLEHTALLSTRNSQGNIAKGNVAMLNWDATGALAKIRVPVLILAGDMDIVTKPDASHAMTEQTPSAQLRVIDGANHMGFLERPDVYNQAIEEFARSILKG